MNLRIARDHTQASDCSVDSIRDRLRSTFGSQSCRAIGLRTRTHPETVRRYLSNGHPSIEFLIAVIRGYDVSASWLLLGAGPQKQHEVIDHSIQSASLSHLLRGIAEKLAASEGVGRLPAVRNGAPLRMTSAAAGEPRFKPAGNSSVLSTST